MFSFSNIAKQASQLTQCDVFFFLNGEIRFPLHRSLRLRFHIFFYSNRITLNAIRQWHPHPTFTRNAIFYNSFDTISYRLGYPVECRMSFTLSAYRRQTLCLCVCVLVCAISNNLFMPFVLNSKYENVKNCVWNVEMK